MSKMLHSDRLDMDFEGEIIHMGLAIEDEGGEHAWPHDKWTFVLDGQAFEFKTGIGCHRKMRRKSPISPPDNFESSYYGLTSMSGKHWNAMRLKRFGQVSTLSGKPTVDDLLYSLVSDASSGRETFEDWCSELGYDTDSRKAFSIYEQCQNTIGKLRKIGVSDLDAASEAFQDY